MAYVTNPGTTPGAEVSALAAVYKLCLSSHANRKAAGVNSTNGGDLTMKNNKGVSHVDQRAS
jgi:hypothetical protein